MRRQPLGDPTGDRHPPEVAFRREDDDVVPDGREAVVAKPTLFGLELDECQAGHGHGESDELDAAHGGSPSRRGDEGGV